MSNVRIDMEEGKGGHESKDFDPLLLGSVVYVDDDDILVGINVPEGHRPLTAKPLVLSSTALSIILICNFLFVLSIVAIILCSGQDGTYQTSRPFVLFAIRYIPTLIGIITILASRTIVFAFSRLDFYMSMADAPLGGKKNASSSQSRGDVARPYFEWMPDLYRHLPGRPSRRPRYWLRLILFINSIFLFFMPTFKSTFLLASPSPGSGDAGTWTVTMNAIPTCSLIFLYIVNIISISSLLIHLWSRCTGLKWDPTTIADHLALFHVSNVLRDFEILERNPDQAASKLLKHKEYRLGYWEKGRDRRIVYGIGRETSSYALSSSQGSIDGTDSANPVHGMISVPSNDSLSGNKTCTTVSHLPFCRCPQKYNTPRDPQSKNSYYRPWSVAFWWILCLGSLCVCIYAVISGAVVGGFRLQNSWWQSDFLGSSNASWTTTPPDTSFDPDVDSSPFNKDSTGIFQNDPATHVLYKYVFVFQEIPVFVSSLFAIYFIECVDIGHRFSQPFANMAWPGTSAKDSILLGYHWGTPGLVTIDAVRNRHWRVVLFSSINLISPLFPIFVGGLFTMTNTGTEIVFDIHKVSFILVFIYLIVFVLALPFAWPTRDRRLPRFVKSIADLMSLCYASRALRNPALDISNPNTTKADLQARLSLQAETYSIGLYTGSDGKRHFGFDAAYLKDEAGNTLMHVRPLRKWPEDEMETL